MGAAGQTTRRALTVTLWEAGPQERGVDEKKREQEAGKGLDPTPRPVSKSEPEF